MKRFVKNVALVLLVWLLFIILCLVIPPAFHKRATPEDWLNDIRYEHTAPERVRSIDDNSDALLWRLQGLLRKQRSGLYSPRLFLG